MASGDSNEKAKYDGLSREQLIALLEKRDRQKKLGLVWERDEIEADRALEAEFVAADLLTDRSDPAGGRGGWPNLVIEGDNYDALRWLRMTLAGRVKCIYVDPPYNTGAKDWVYNDHYVGKEDRWRHSTWLEFLHRRFSLARDLLTEDGVILVSINDENRAKLELLLDEVLPAMRVGSFVWRTKDAANDAEHNFSSVHEHVLIFATAPFSFPGHELDTKKYKTQTRTNAAPIHRTRLLSQRHELRGRTVTSRSGMIRRLGGTLAIPTRSGDTIPESELVTRKGGSPPSKSSRRIID